MNPHDIKALLGKAGVKQVDIARKLRVSPNMINHVIFRKSKSRRVASAISRAVERSKSELWPDVYGPKKQTAAR